MSTLNFRASYAPGPVRGDTQVTPGLPMLQVTYCKRRHFRTVHIFAHFRQGSRCAKKYDVSEKIKYYSANRINC